MLIGLDFGTTNSSAAFYDSERVHLFQIDACARDPAVMRSIVYLTRGHDVFIGQEAIDTYYQQNTGRPSRMVRQYIGEIEMTFGDVGSIKGYPVRPHNFFQEVYVLVDELTPGRLLQSLKSSLAGGDGTTLIFGREFALEELIALFLGAVRLRVEEQSGKAVDGLVLGRPVSFAGAHGVEDNDRSEARLHRSALAAGFREVVFELEPVAAALHYELTVAGPQNVVVFDLGGGTLDLTVMRVGERKQGQVYATGGVAIGGDAFDQRVISRLLLDHFGRGSTWGDDAIPLPNRYTDALTSWQTVLTLAQPETFRFLHEAQMAGSHPARIRGLESLLTNNYTMGLVAAVERAKVALSSDHFAVIRLRGEDVDVWQPITRSQFEAIVARAAARVEACVLETMACSGLGPEQIDAVVQTGGSAQIPLFVRMMGRIFGAEKIVHSHVFTGVAAGLAVRAAQLEGRSRSV